MRANELLRRLRRRASRLAMTHEETQGKGSHVKVVHGNRQTVVPMHAGDMPKGTYRAILRQLDLRETDLKD